MKIGLVYVKGAVPGFEEFGNLPTNIVKSNGLVNGVLAHKELDALIIPGGSIMESGSILPDSDLAKEIKLIAKEGNPIIGVCSGFQVLGNKTDIGRKSPVPIEKEGLKLIDVNFSPLINNDKVVGKVVNSSKSFLTKNIKEPVTGFHCHTYGNIKGDGTPILFSHLKRVNYKDVNKESYEILDGAVNDNGNVVGLMIHKLLDENPKIVKNIFNFIDASEKDISNIYLKNKELLKKINKEIGIDTGIFIDKINSKNNSFSSYKKEKEKMPLCLMIGSTGSDSGKTFITTGLAGALRKKGLNVGILKVGPDIRDTVPGLYLTKGKMEDYASIKIGHLGWVDIKEVLVNLKDSNYDIILIESVMSLLTGLLNKKTPYSGAEIAISSNIPIILVSGVNKGGIESAAIDLVSHGKLLQKMNLNIKSIILNKVYDNEIFNEVVPFIKKETGIENIIAIPKIKLDERSTIPEVEIKLEEFGLAGLNMVENNINLESLINMADIPSFKKYLSINEIRSYFR